MKLIPEAEVAEVVGKFASTMMRLGYRGIIAAGVSDQREDGTTEVVASILGSWNPPAAGHMVEHIVNGFTHVFDEIMVKESIDDSLMEMGIDPTLSDGDPDVIYREEGKPIRFIGGSNTEADDILKRCILEGGAEDWE